MRHVSSPILVAMVAGLTVPAPAQFVPEGLPASLTRIVADRAIFLDPEARGALGNWEPYTSVLGNTIFLIESNKYAVDPLDPLASMQSYGIALQPVAGGDNVEVEAFWDDEGQPYSGPINQFRQNGNPGRVAGDPRPGATSYITGGEGSPDKYLDYFGSDGRFDDLVREGRYAVVQTFTATAAPLAAAPSSRAFDAINGRSAGDITAVGAEIGRFGGDVAGLSDGNFVVVVDDRSLLHNSSRVSTAVIVAADGSIVRETFVVCPEPDALEGQCAETQIWSNVAAFRGGFCVRVRGVLVFFDNNGDRIGEIDQAVADVTGDDGVPVFSFDRGRGDGTRIASHVNSDHVFLAGRYRFDGANDHVRVAVFSAPDQSFVGSFQVNEDDFLEPADRVAIAVDALNRVTVAWESQPKTFLATSFQVVARVLAFDAAAGSMSPLTPTFFAFVNHYDTEGAVGPITTFRAHVSMTTRQILIAAKGSINLSNMPELGGDSPAETNFYTVFSHPDPQDDPTPGAGGSRYIRGDTNNDGRADLSDSVFLLNHLFLGSPRWVCEASAFVNPDDRIDLSDAVYLLTHLFLGGPAPPAPYPDCGADPAGGNCAESTCNR